eukprot:765518-Hanusia_phi.AAC.5
MMRNFALVGLSSSKRCIALKSKLLPLRSMAVYSLGNDCPSLDKGAWVAPNAAVRSFNAAHLATERTLNAGAHALVLENTVIPDGSLVLGSPAKVVKQLSPEQVTTPLKHENVLKETVTERSYETWSFHLHQQGDGV